MYIKLINCKYVHIYNKSSFVYTTDNVCVFDEVSTQLISILKSVSAYDTVIAIFGRQMGLEHQDTINLTNEIIRVNHQFLIISNSPNTTMITGQLMARFPSMLQISLTNRCVHQCKHCFKNCNFAGKNDLSFEALLDLLNQVKGECKFIEFTGGEPLLYPHLMDAVRVFHNLFHLRITTSGYLIHDFSLPDLRKFEMIQISLQGSTDCIHDSFVGKTGSFHIVTNNIRWLCANRINVVVSRSLQAYDEDEIDNFIRLCISLGVRRVILGIIVPAGRAIQTKCATRDEEHEKITAYLKKVQKKYPQIDIDVDEEHAISNQHSKYVFHCIGGRLHLYINESGDVFPCPYCQEDFLSMGNIIDEPDFFDRVIKQSQYDMFNKKILSYFDKNELQFWQMGSHPQDICPNIRAPEL